MLIPVIILAVLTAVYVHHYTVGPREINYNGEMCVLYNDGIEAKYNIYKISKRSSIKPSQLKVVKYKV